VSAFADESNLADWPVGTGRRGQAIPDRLQSAIRNRRSQNVLRQMRSLVAPGSLWLQAKSDSASVLQARSEFVCGCQEGKFRITNWETFFAKADSGSRCSAHSLACRPWSIEQHTLAVFSEIMVDRGDGFRLSFVAFPIPHYDASSVPFGSRLRQPFAARQRSRRHAEDERRTRGGVKTTVTFEGLQMQNSRSVRWLVTTMSARRANLVLFLWLRRPFLFYY